MAMGFEIVIHRYIFCVRHGSILIAETVIFLMEHVSAIFPVTRLCPL